MGGGGAMLLAPASLKAAGDGVDPRVAQVMSATIGIDMHNHVYPAGREPHLQHGGQPGRPEQTQQAPELSLADELKRSGLTAVCASFVLDFAKNDKPSDAQDNFLRWLTAIDAQLEKGHIRRALNLEDLQAAHDHGPPMIVQTVEGAHFNEGHPDRVEEVYKRGLRDLQLLHERDDMENRLLASNELVAAFPRLFLIFLHRRIVGIKFCDGLVVFVALYPRNKAFEYFVGGHNSDLFGGRLTISCALLDRVGIAT